MVVGHDILDLISSLRGEKRELEESIKGRLAEVEQDLMAAERALELLRNTPNMKRGGS